MKPDSTIRLLKYLNDALAAAEEIHIATVGLNEKNFYFNNIKWHVERGIEIISEALKRALQVEPDTASHITDLSKIFSTRNKIAHEYDLVDPLQLYTITVKSIPTLITELKKFIEQIESGI